MRMLRHSCQLEILKWSGKGDSLQVLLVLLSIHQLLSPVFSHIPFSQVVTPLTVPVETALSLEADIKCLSSELASMGQDQTLWLQFTSFQAVNLPRWGNSEAQPKSVTRGCLRESLNFGGDGGSHHSSDLAQPHVDCGASQHSHPMKPKH